jgi:hypothetical protein
MFLLIMQSRIHGQSGRIALSEGPSRQMLHLPCSSEDKEMYYVKLCGLLA